MDYERTQVECYSGYMANERPTAFSYQGHHREITEIVDRWHEGGSDPARSEISYFKVKTAQGGIFSLRYLSLFDTWSIKPL